MKEECLKIGRFVKIHGINGELVLETEHSSIKENIGESLLVEIDQQLVPFFVTEVSDHNTPNRIRIQFDWISDEKEAARLNNCDVYMLKEEYQEVEGMDPTEEIHLLKGFSIVDNLYGEVGVFEDIIQDVSNPLLVIDHDGTEVLIPLQAEILQEIDQQNRVIYIDAPEGLIDLYLGE